MKKIIIRTFVKSLSLSMLGYAVGITILGTAFAATKLETQSVPMLKLTGEVGAINQIQYVTELDQTNTWLVLTNIVMTSSTQYYVDTGATGAVKRFYQVVILGNSPTNVPSGMVLIPAGVFTIGDTLGDWPNWVGSSDATPTHNVNVSAFYMDKTLVTKTLWDDVFVWAGVHGYINPGYGKGTNHPVHSIIWYDMVKWCNARSEKMGLIPAYYTSAEKTTVYRSGQLELQNDWVNWNAGYRLPTEAEWEKAARGGLSNNRFPWGDTITHSQANYNSVTNEGLVLSYDISPTAGYHPDYDVDPQPYTSPVASFAPNGYGLYDMAGNVCERCWDWYGPYGSAYQSDPRGPDSGLMRVWRGGDWSDNADSCRVARRNSYSATYKNAGLGFRTVLPLNQ